MKLHLLKLRPLLMVWLTCSGASLLSAPAVAAIITVNSTADPTEKGKTTLRDAITMANNGMGGDTIVINVPKVFPATITLTDKLPAISKPNVTIDGTQQRGYKPASPSVELFPLMVMDMNGNMVIAPNLAGASALTFGGGGGKLIALLIAGFANDVELTSQGNTVTGCTLANATHGVYINDVPGNTVKASILVFNSDGVYIAHTAATQNVVQSCLIGIGLGGVVQRNTTGVDIFNAPGNTIGGMTATPGTSLGNVVSGNGVGVALDGPDAKTNMVIGNLIGTDSGGTNALPNGRGVVIRGAAQNTVGGASAQTRNIISGNTASGIEITRASIGGTPAQLNFVEGNFIGTDITGTKPLPNGRDGVLLRNGAINNVIGGGDIIKQGNLATLQTIVSQIGSAPGNVISGNTRDGILMDGSADAVTGNVVQRNFIGVKADSATNGFAALPNGVAMDGTSTGGNGITIEGANATGNVIGLDITTSLRFLYGNGNVIAGNKGHGVALGAAGNFVRGNFIGCEPAGPKTIPNSRDGVIIVASPMNIIGRDPAFKGDVSLALFMRNVIGGNQRHGIEISGNGATANQVTGNYLGLNIKYVLVKGFNEPFNVPLGNGDYGLFLVNGAAKNSASSNKFGYNKVGTKLDATAGLDNSIDPNSFFANLEGGIELADEPTPDSPDEGTGPNDLMRAPILTSVTSSAGGSQTLVQFLVDSHLAYPVHVEFFDNGGPDPAGKVEGETYLNSVDVSAPDTYTITLPAASLITATATDANGNTSEFSLPLAVSPCAADVSALVKVTRGGFRLDHSLGLYVQVVTLTNTGSAPIPAPVSLVLDNLSSTVTLYNGDGVTLCAPPLGSPFLNVDLAEPSVLIPALPPGQQTSVELLFLDPANAGITYTTRVLAGAGER